MTFTPFCLSIDFFDEKSYTFEVMKKSQIVVRNSFDPDPEQDPDSDFWLGPDPDPDSMNVDPNTVMKTRFKQFFLNANLQAFKTG